MLVLGLETAVRRRRVLKRSWTPEEKGLSREPLSASGAPGRDNDFLRVAPARASADRRQAKERGFRPPLKRSSIPIARRAPSLATASAPG